MKTIRVLFDKTVNMASGRESRLRRGCKVSRDAERDVVAAADAYFAALKWTTVRAAAY